MSESTAVPAIATPSALEWRWKHFADLSALEVYAMLAARSAVFVMEQDCLYGDIDGIDPHAWHLLAIDATQSAASAPLPALAGYLRVLLPDATSADVRIGRVLTTQPYRGIKLGNAMLERSLQHIRAQWPGTPVSLHAQAHLQKFYGAFGFTPSSEIHDEDGIPHVWMRSPS